MESQFLAFVGGQFGLRPGEICHMTEDWINWRRWMVEIPQHEGWEKAKDGGICGYCRQNAQQRVEYNSLTLPEAQLEVLREEMGPHLPYELSGRLQAMHRAAVDSDLDDEFIERQLTSLLESTETAQDADVLLEAIDEAAQKHQSRNSIDMEDGRDLMWRAKTENAARKVPFDCYPRTEFTIERFFDRFDAWPESFTTIARRVDEVLQEADEPDQSSTTPHGLQATAALRSAASGMTPLAMRSMFGWSSISTARAYVSDSPANTQRQLHQRTHGNFKTRVISRSVY